MCVFLVDSMLVAEQLNGNYACRSEGPAGYVLQMCVNLEGPHQPRAVADPSHISRVQRDGGRARRAGGRPGTARTGTAQAIRIVVERLFIFSLCGSNELGAIPPVTPNFEKR